MSFCHWTVGVGLPLAAAVKTAVPPDSTPWLTGCVVIWGAKSTVIVAASLVTLPRLLVAAVYTLYTAGERLTLTEYGAVRELPSKPEVTS